MRRTGLLLGLLVVTWCAFAQAALGFGQVPGSPFATGTGDFGVGVALSADANTVLIGGQDDNSHVGVAWVFTTPGGGQGDGQGVTTFVRKPFVTHGSDVSFTVRCAHATCHDRATETLTETLKGKGIVSISTAGHHGARVSKKTVIVASVTITIAPGATRKVTLTFNKTGRTLLARFGRLPIHLTVGQRQANGRLRTIKSVQLTAKRAPAKKRKHYVIAAGWAHTCALAAGGQVYCWPGTTTGSSLTAVRVAGISGATAIAAGQSYACAVVAGGQVYCWLFSALTLVRLAGIRGATAIAVGEDHACAVVAGGQIDCWGGNGDGQLGNGTTIDSSTPVRVAGLGGATAVTAGEGHTCAVVAGGQIDCWGRNDVGQLGNGTPRRGCPAYDGYCSTTPSRVAGISGATAITAGWLHTCALLTGGAIDCWGHNDAGQLGNGTTTDSFTPVRVAGISGATAITAGGEHACALVAGGQVECWGGAHSGAQLGNGTTTDSLLTPWHVGGISGATGIAAGVVHQCVVVAGGPVECWGVNIVGELGNGTTANSLTPVQVKGIP